MPSVVSTYEKPRFGESGFLIIRANGREFGSSGVRGFRDRVSVFGERERAREQERAGVRVFRGLLFERF
jgi:hypothetical protein